MRKDSRLSCPPGLVLGGRAAPSQCHQDAVPILVLTLSSVLLAGEQTKALVTQLTLFNRVLTELREDIRDQVRRWGTVGFPWVGFAQERVPASKPHPPHAPRSAAS